MIIKIKVTKLRLIKQSQITVSKRSCYFFQQISLQYIVLVCWVTKLDTLNAHNYILIYLVLVTFHFSEKKERNLSLFFGFYISSSWIFALDGYPYGCARTGYCFFFLEKEDSCISIWLNKMSLIWTGYICNIRVSWATNLWSGVLIRFTENLGLKNHEKLSGEFHEEINSEGYTAMAA